ncbi:alpha-L-fucosidase [Algoriphagus zhangzhouensis]|uniref:alpha-L-fucosidase n=1 Tax=Algoriphagus zhangzhouensis TaxID=1073327 RepID=A0A1M7ZIV0_9BACT|nr:alpha-L-fucosidase [Algoriphagus zhangzhouensis]TDY43692.1 alpha-L-fucosidase [Algoriphagus zhangzhouensis]SHO64811.1 alpha-L-fucosidase [Algoriphagus zhangzhouensis]
MIKYLSKTVFLTVSFAAFSFSLFAQTPKNTPRTSLTLEYGAHRIGKRTDQMMETWRNYGLGQFIHWGVYALTGGHWDGEYYSGAAEWIRSWDKMPKDAYDQLYKSFDPKNYEPKAWAKQAKEMGAKYMIITTKHHDGFSLWPSKYTDYDVTNSPYGNDIIGPLVEAYDAEGIDVYLYFSVMDWSQPGYRVSLETEEDRTAYEDFKAFTRNQLIELLELYPSAKGLWFDGTWDEAWKEQAVFADELEKEMRAMIPGLIIGSRFRPDDYGNRHFDSNGDLMGDYEQGWERKLPNTYEDTKGNDWDAVMTVPENQWGYHSDWRGHVKSSYELIEMLVKSVSLDGNFVLNFGPDGQGNIRSEEAKLAKEIGDWMKVNQKAIYSCGYLNWQKQDWGYYTQSREDGKIYMVVFNQPLDGKLRVKTADKVILDKVYPLENPGMILTPELIQKNEYFIPVIMDQKWTSPYVIVVESSSTDEDKNGGFQKAKT